MKTEERRGTPERVGDAGVDADEDIHPVYR